MSRSQDTVIDDDEETCPLCIEEFDLSDKNFRPCPCGYQICQFCFNSLKTTYEKSTCPNCRRPYDEKTIQYKIPTAEEFKQDLQNKNKKQAAAKRKETEKREVESSSRRNLAGVRVKQQNLVYVIGLIPQIKDEQALLQTLRGPDYFGQYGDIEKIVVSKAKAGAPNQGVGVYVTYARKEDAALCISTVDGSMNGDRVLRAQFGTTKYCSAFLRGETCNNKNCSFLHETGEDGQHSSLQNEPHSKPSSIRPPGLGQTNSYGLPPRPVSTTQSVTSQPMLRQDSREDSDSRKGSTDASALPSTASWANGVSITSLIKNRASSQSASVTTSSPQLTHAVSAAVAPDEHKPKELPLANDTTRPTEEQRSTAKSIPEPPYKAKTVSTNNDPVTAVYDHILRTVSSQQFQFVFSDATLTDEEKAAMDHLPIMIDPFGGAKRRVMADRESAERARIESDTKAKLELQARSAAEDALDEEMGAGSLALGGEPEDNPRGISARGAVGRPPHMSSSSFLNDQFSTMSLNPRSLTPQQRQQLGLLNTSNLQQASNLSQPPTQNIAFEMSDFDRRAPQYSAAQFEQISSHQRHGSRYFNNDSKSTAPNRFQGQQQSYYTSAVQGPPPGLPTAGTPPISGGGMFAHGQGFTNPGFGATKDANTELHIRNRSGTNTGPDASKRGGVESLADPSIVQARVHQGGNPGQGLFGGNQVDDKNFPPLPIRNDNRPITLHSRVSSFQSHQSSSARSSTPRVPPGFENTHAHPPASNTHDVPVDPPERTSSKAPTAISMPMLPAVPILPTVQHVGTPAAFSAEKTQSYAKIDKPTEAKAEIIDGHETDSSASKSESAIAKSANLDETGTDLKQAETKVTHKDAFVKTSNSVQESDETSKIVREIPSKIITPEVPTPVSISTSTQSISKPGTPVLDTTTAATPPPTISQPNTPGTITSEVSRASMTRPRTLRLTTSMIQKTTEVAPASAATDRPSVPSAASLTRGLSRHGSISSITRSRPSTPTMSERLDSRDVSRASSPPPSIVGSAPERMKTKSQQKKDKREKAKKMEGSDSNGATAVATTSEPVGPIVARQKKQKKQKDDAATDIQNPVMVEKDTKSEAKLPEAIFDKRDNATAMNKPLSNKKEASITKSKQSPVPKPETPTSVEDEEEQTTTPEPAKTSYTLRDFYNDVSKLSENDKDGVSKLLADHISPMSKIVSSMIASGDLAREHPWLNPPSFNSAIYKLPTDGKRGQDYLDSNGYSTTHAFGQVYVPQKQKRALYAGHAVSVINGGNRRNDLLSRCMITSNGWVMRHLSRDESEKLLNLEERRSMYVDEFGDIGSMTALGGLESDDFINLDGGMDGLARYSERHGVTWVQGDEAAGSGDEYTMTSGASGQDAFDGIDGEAEDDDENELLDADDMLSDGTEDLGIEFDPTLGSAAGIASSGVNMPGAWQASSYHSTMSYANPSTSSATTVVQAGSSQQQYQTSMQAQAKQNHPQQPSNLNSTLPATTVGGIPARHRTRPVPTVNLRAFDADNLAKRVAEKQKEVEAARKEVEKMEKAFVKKGKDIGRWRESLFKAAAGIVGA